MRKLLFMCLAVAMVVMNVEAQAESNSNETTVIPAGNTMSWLMSFDAQETGEETISEDRRPWLFFVEGDGGKERMKRDDFPGGRCAGLLGVKFGVTPQLTDNVEFEAAFGGKFNVRDGENSSIFGDVAVNRWIGSSFVGAGVSFWDLTEEDTRSVAALVHFGIGLTSNGRVQLMGEGRLPLDELDDVGNNYMFWGGLRVRFGPERERQVAPPPPPPPAPPVPPTPPAPAEPEKEPEFVWPEVYFPFDQYVLTAETKQKLDTVVDYMTSHGDVKVTIEGHCCYIGTNEYNQALGQHRADSIKDYLVSKGIAADRLTTVSYGEERPKYDNEKEITRRFNRRGFFVVIRPTS